jgi:lipopolysaccharide transport system permease protein
MVVPDALAIPWRHRRLVARLARRDIAARYRGSIFGPLWALALPLAMLGIYNFAFGRIFGGRFGESATGDAPFALVLFAGLLLFQIFGDIVQSSPSLIRNNATYIKQIIFPLEILPVVAVVVALFNAAVSFAMLLVFYAILIEVPPISALWIGVIALPLIFLAIGAGWLLSSIGAYFRDLTQVAGLVCTATLFLTPIFYPLEAVPASLRTVIGLNPIATVVEQARSVLFRSEPPDFMALALCLLGSLVVYFAGFAVFQRLRPHFADLV